MVLAALAASAFLPMQAELQRSLARLKTEASGPPYFLAYRVIDQSNFEAAAAYGAVTQESRNSFRAAYVEARVGDRKLDNTDLSYHGWHGSAAEDPEVLRQQLWSLTDRAYKSAVAGLLEKKAKRAVEFVRDPLDDFAAEPPAVSDREEPLASIDAEAAKALIARLSRRFRREPAVYEGAVHVRLSSGRRYLLTSEGTKVATPLEHVPGLLRMSVTTRATDGQRIDLNKSWGFKTLGDLPTERFLEEEADKLTAMLARARVAPLQDPMAAPALLDSEMTGVLFHEALGHKLEGQRQRDPQQSQVFRDLVGRPIIPAFLSLHDDPTLDSYKGVPLAGHYAFDAEGTPARRAVLVEDGVLREFLLSRWPVKGFDRSNGHGRADLYRHASGRMANLIVGAKGAVPASRLKERLMEMARKAGKPYGFRLVGAFGGENPNSRDSAQTLEVRPRLVYRVDAATGREELVRGVKLVGTPLVVLNRIVAAGDDDEAAAGFVCSAESGHVPVSQIAPSVLVSEVELQRLPEDRAVPPILPSPFHDRP